MTMHASGMHASTKAMHAPMYPVPYGWQASLLKRRGSRVRSIYPTVVIKGKAK